MAGIPRRYYDQFEKIPIDFSSPEYRGTKQQRDLAELDNNQLLRRIAFDLGVDLRLRSIDLAFTPVAITVLVTASVQLIAPSQFPRGYLIMNADFTAGHHIFIGGPEVTTASGYPLIAGVEKSFYLRENVSLYAIAETADVSVRLLQLQ